MIIKPPRTSKDRRANRWPNTVLLCDGVACNERHDFPRNTTFAEITQVWFRHNFWTTTFRNGKFEHRCARCQRLTKAPAAYLERLQA